MNTLVLIGAFALAAERNPLRLGRPTTVNRTGRLPGAAMRILPVVCLYSVGGLTLAQDDGLPLRADVLRTPDVRFDGLPDFSFEPHYVSIDGYRVHYVDEGNRDAALVLMLHGEPTWSFLYRKMVPVLVGEGHRVIAPDLIGFGRSDKPISADTHTYAFHVGAIAELIVQLDLSDITLVCQDWGSLIGLRVAAENPDRFARIVLSNGGLPTGRDDFASREAFMAWRASVEQMNAVGDMPIGDMMSRQFGVDIGAACAAPFPDPSFKAGPLRLPLLVPMTPEDPATAANERAWEVLRNWDKPFLTAYSDGDPITAGLHRRFQAIVPGARGQPHTVIRDAGHFVQEDKGEEFARIVAEFIESTK